MPWARKDAGRDAEGQDWLTGDADWCDVLAQQLGGDLVACVDCLADMRASQSQIKRLESNRVERAIRCDGAVAGRRKRNAGMCIEYGVWDCV
jgi:hypothetical protein